MKRSIVLVAAVAPLIAVLSACSHEPAPEVLRPVRTLEVRYGEAREAYLGAVGRAIGAASMPEVYRLAAIGELFYAGRFEDTLRRMREG